MPVAQNRTFTTPDLRPGLIRCRSKMFHPSIIHNYKRLWLSVKQILLFFCFFPLFYRTCVQNCHHFAASHNYDRLLMADFKSVSSNFADFPDNSLDYPRLISYNRSIKTSRGWCECIQHFCNEHSEMKFWLRGER